MFRGCGGGDIGAKRAGAQIIFANDNSSTAIATYRQYRLLMVEQHADIRFGDVANIKTFPTCELLIGCYPCQSFTMGGPRNPDAYQKSRLFLQFRRALIESNPKYFVAENVGGMAWLKAGRYLEEHLEAFETAGRGYAVTSKILNVKDYRVPADRRRVFMVGVRKDLDCSYSFPKPSHGPESTSQTPWTSHGDAISALFERAEGEYYDYPKEPFTWWYLSRNRKRRWDTTSYMISGNDRHIPLHPASPTMRLVESMLHDGSKQRWEFAEEYLSGQPWNGHAD